VALQHCITQTSNHIGYRPIRFLLLVSLLVIGCVELNPGPDHETSATSESGDGSPKFIRRSGTGGQHGVLCEIKMAAFFFARTLRKTEEFHLASNVDGAGAFDDMVFRYRLKEPDVWKTCPYNLSIRNMEAQISGKYNLLKYFESYCEVKSKASTDHKLKQCGSFDDSEFVIYTNARLESKSALQRVDSEPISILSYRKNWGSV